MKLKDEDIKEIARLIDEGWSYIKLACKFNMGKTNMNSLVRRYKMHGLRRAPCGGHRGGDGRGV